MSAATWRERAHTAVTVTSLAVAAAAVAFGHKHRRAARSLSQAEIDALVASAMTQLALDDNLDEHTGASVGWLVRHEQPPDQARPYFWFAAVAGGPDLRYSARAIRSDQGFAATHEGARDALTNAVVALAEPETESE